MPASTFSDPLKVADSVTWKCLPAWSLSIVFFVTVVLCLAAVKVYAIVRRGLRKKRFQRAYKRNSGMVNIGKRTTLPKNGLRPWGSNGHLAKTDIPDIRIGQDISSSSVGTSECNAREYLGASSTKMGLGTTLPIPSTGNLSIASGVYAQVDTESEKQDTRVNNKIFNSNRQIERSNASVETGLSPYLFEENSYFTPVLRPRSGSSQRQFPTAGILGLSKKVRRQLVSSTAVENGQSMLGTPKLLKLGSPSSVFDDNIVSLGTVASLHEVVSGEDNNCTYLTFNDVSVIITPPISRGVRQSVEMNTQSCQSRT